MEETNITHTQQNIDILRISAPMLNGSDLQRHKPKSNAT